MAFPFVRRRTVALTAAPRRNLKALALVAAGLIAVGAGQVSPASSDGRMRAESLALLGGEGKVYWALRPDGSLARIVWWSRNPNEETPAWIKWLFPFALTNVALTNASTSPWTIPSDWSNTNTINVLGCGGNGAPQDGLGSGGSGGGGAAIVFLSNYTGLTAGGTATFVIPAGGGNATTTFNTSSFIADYGRTADTTPLAGVGGLNTNSTVPAGGTKYSGGAGFLNAGVLGGDAGGGAAGINGVGSDAPSLVTGGAADNNTVAGGTTGTNGNSGTEFDGTHGSGSGAGGTNVAAHAGWNGGKYGGGGGGAHNGSSVVGVGGDGLIFIVYTPAVASPWVPRFRAATRVIERRIVV